MFNVPVFLLIHYDRNTNRNLDDAIQQSTALRWLPEFLGFAHEVMVPFTPRLIPAILPNLAHHVVMIQTAAIRTNKLLLNVIQNLPSPADGPTRGTVEKAASTRTAPVSPTPTGSSVPSRASTLAKDESFEVFPDTPSQIPVLQRCRVSTLDSTPRPTPSLDSPLSPLLQPPSGSSRPQSPLSSSGLSSYIPSTIDEGHLLDYQGT